MQTIIVDYLKKGRAEMGFAFKIGSNASMNTIVDRAVAKTKVENPKAELIKIFTVRKTICHFQGAVEVKTGQFIQ